MECLVVSFALLTLMEAATNISKLKTTQFYIFGKQITISIDLEILKCCDFDYLTIILEN